MILDLADHKIFLNFELRPEESENIFSIFPKSENIFIGKLQKMFFVLKKWNENFENVQKDFFKINILFWSGITEKNQKI